MRKKHNKIKLFGVFFILVFSIFCFSVDSSNIVVENNKSKDEDYIYYYDPASAGWMGMGPACVCDGWRSAIRLTQEELEPYNEWNLTGVNVLRHGNGNHSGTIEIFREGTPSQPGPIITSGPYYFNEPKWFRVNLNESVQIKEHNEIWIAVVWHTEEPDIYPHAVDDYFPVIGKSDWVYLPDSGWSELHDYGFDFSWCMEAIVQCGEINQPPLAPTIAGPNTGKPNTAYDFTFNTVDPDGDDVKFHIDWNDGNSEITSYTASGSNMMVSHTWTGQGTYTISVYAEDENGANSGTTTSQMIIEKSKTMNHQFIYWLQSHPNFFPILQRMFQRLGLQ